MRVILAGSFYRRGIRRILCAEEIQPQKTTKATRKSIQAVETLELQPETLEIPIYSQGTVEAVTSGNLNMQVTGGIIYTGKGLSARRKVQRGKCSLKLIPLITKPLRPMPMRC